MPMTQREQSHDKLWQNYLRTQSAEARKALVKEYVGLVKFVISKFRNNARQSTSVIDEDDLLQIGMMGLLDSIDRFDPTRGVKFETYAITRIRGTVQDELRKLDWVPRSVREKLRTIDRVTQKIECTQVLSTSAKRITRELAMTLDEYMTMVRDVQIGVPEVVGQHNQGEDVLDDLTAEDDADPSERVAEDQVKEMVVRMVENLPPQDKLIISLYYYEELTFKEIAGILHLSESRVFQRHATILERLRDHAGELV
ncbi:MAG: hypothetical protein C4326_00605 [Ignavibacteria bacterium]